MPSELIMDRDGVQENKRPEDELDSIDFDIAAHQHNQTALSTSYHANQSGQHDAAECQERFGYSLMIISRQKIKTPFFFSCKILMERKARDDDAPKREKESRQKGHVFWVNSLVYTEQRHDPFNDIWSILIKPCENSSLLFSPTFFPPPTHTVSNPI